jgi:hypothetical protein
VAAFNKKHTWLKRGISMTHCRLASAHIVGSTEHTRLPLGGAAMACASKHGISCPELCTLERSKKNIQTQLSKIGHLQWLPNERRKAWLGSRRVRPLR